MGREVALSAAATAAAILVGGCGSNGGTPREGKLSSAPPGSAGAILARPGQDLALSMGTSDYAKGPVRVSFLAIDKQGRSIERPTAHVWVAKSLDSKPFLETTARSEDIGVTGVSEKALGGVSKIYVARLRVPQAGKYVMVAEPVGAKVQGAADLDVRDHTTTPAVGSKAFTSNTPTIESTNGDFAALTTADPPDKGLLRYSVADSLAAHVPFVVAFATPAFCSSRTCGPTVDVVDYVRRHLGARGVRFIHVEIYQDNQPPNVNRWVKEWKLQTEPWVFLVGPDGRIKERFEGAVSADELGAAVSHYLVR